MVKYKRHFLQLATTVWVSLELAPIISVYEYYMYNTRVTMVTVELLW